MFIFFDRTKSQQIRASTCRATNQLKFAPDWNWDKFARIAYTGSTRYSFISFSASFRTGISVLKTMPISPWWLVWLLCLWTTTNYAKNYLNFILLSFGTKKGHVPDTEVSFISGSVRYTGPKTFADEKLLLLLRSSWYLTVVQQSKKPSPRISLTDSKFWKMNSSLKSNKTKHND